jgi:hypothetical protein
LGYPAGVLQAMHVMSVHQQLSSSSKVSPCSPVHANPLVVVIVVPAQQQKQQQHEFKTGSSRLQATHQQLKRSSTT